MYYNKKSTYKVKQIVEERMPNNRRRKTRKSNIIKDTISNKNFIIIFT